MKDVEPLENPWEFNFRKHLVAQRERSGLSQTGLAKRLADRGLPFHQQTIQRLELGDRAVRLDEAFVIADEIGLKLEDMVKPLNSALAPAYYAIQDLERTVREVARETLDDHLNRTLDATTRVIVEFEDFMERGSEAYKRELAVLVAWVHRGFDACMEIAKLTTVLAGSFSGRTLQAEVEGQLRELGDEIQSAMEGEEQTWESLPPTERPKALRSLDWSSLSAYTENVMDPRRHG